MGAYDRRSYLRPTVLLVVFLMHCGAILIFMRERRVYADRDVAPQASMTVFFIDSRARIEPAPAEMPRAARRAGRSVERQLVPESSPTQDSGVGPTIDWAAEREKSIADILDHGQAGQAAGSGAAPVGAAPWDPDARLFETNGHGFTVRIPVEIPGKIIDHCFGFFDLGQNQGGKWEKYKLGCTLRKQPARGDLFDSLRPLAERQK